MDDGDKPLYQVIDAAAANFPMAALGIAARLFEDSGVPFAAAEPLLRAVVDNAFLLGPDAALTGPIARGDLGTVVAQVAAVKRSVAELASAFRDMSRATAVVAGRADDLEGVL